MKKILICDDEIGLRKVLRKYAEYEEFQVYEATNGLEGVKLCNEIDFDIIIMDIMMPKLDGFGAVHEIRKTKNTPIIMLSAKGEEYDKVMGFELGIDDYVVKPFSSKEVMLRINAILKRLNTSENEQTRKHIVYEKEGLKIDFSAYKIYIDNQHVKLSPKGYELLFYLVKNKNIVITREKILNEVWGYDYFGDDRTLDTHMKLLRKTLGSYGEFISTVRGVGYRFEG